GSEDPAVHLVNGAVAVGVAEQPEETACPVAAGQAVAVTVQLASPTVVYPCRPDGEDVVAIGEGASDEVRCCEGKYRHGLAADRRDGDLEVNRGACPPAQLDCTGFEEGGAAEFDGDAVNHGALGGPVVDDDALHGCGRACERVVGALVQGPHS